MTFNGKHLLAAMFCIWLAGCQIDVNLPDTGDASPGDQNDNGQSDNDPGDSDDTGDTGDNDSDTNAKAVDWQCDPEQLRSITQDAFAPSIAEASTECVNDLFSLTGDAAADVFAESRMTAVGHYLEQNASLDVDLESPILFLRAGYYVQWYQKDDVGEYSVAVKEQSRKALNAILTDERLNQAKPSPVLPEAVTLIDSTALNAEFLPTVIQLLNGYDENRRTERNHSVAVNNAFTVLFRGHQNDDFKDTVLSDQSILTALEAFVADHQGLLGTNEEYILANAVREYGRFLQYNALKPRLRPQVNQWLSEYDMTGETAPLWLAAAEQAEYHDRDHCATYGICGFKDDLEAEVLSFEFDCPNVSVALRAQALDTGRAYDICDTLLDQSDRFHRLFATNRTPVAEDFNDSLEVVIFDSSNDYATYAGLLFGISTDNGGMYLEGDPSDADNQARFIAYRAEWLDEFAVWNLRHEFTHYLDGRFNVQGDFNQSSQFDTIWWSEGMAEYATHLEDSDEAWRLAEQSRIALSTVFATLYSHGTDRVYQWGYLASRYLMEEQPYEVTTLLGYLRSADFEAYERYLDQLGGRYDDAFDQWLMDELEARGDSDDSDSGDNGSEDDARLVNGQVRTMLSSPDAEYFYIHVPEGAHDLRITTTGGEGDVTLYGRNETWPSNSDYDVQSVGNGTDTSIAVSMPQTGTYYYVRLDTTNGFSGVSLTAEFLQ